MPLSRSQSRAFVATLVVLMLALSVLATVLITRGWADEDLQDQVSDMEGRRTSEMPRLSD